MHDFSAPETASENLKLFELQEIIAFVGKVLFLLSSSIPPNFSKKFWKRYNAIV